LLRALALGDVEGHALEELRAALRVLDDARLAVHPLGAAVARQEAALGAERPPGAAAAPELFVPHQAVVGMQPPVPEERVRQPLLLRVAEELLDVRADVDLV